MTEAITSIDSPETLLEILVNCGGESYFGESVTVLEHSLQAAHFALIAGNNQELVIAALLHDVGHLLHPNDEDIAEQGVDTRHEELGQQLLAAHLPPSVTEPIRLHVAAKRYLCFANTEYRNALSPSSALSLGLQGGPMTEDEAADFLRLPFAIDAIALRRWDDEAKIKDMVVPGVGEYFLSVKALWH
jgi:[1-hydroxy-2-(trimethylamino)ethyl]phosphonate dioxygenase